MKRLITLVIMVVTVFTILILGGCSRSGRMQQQRIIAKERQLDKQLDSLTRINEPKKLIMLDNVIAESIGNEHNIISFRHKQDTLTIVYRHYDVWVAWSEPQVGPDGVKHDKKIGYYIPDRLINKAMDRP